MLIGVVGPSGAGKDTLLDGARRALVGEASLRFVRRCVTRPAEAGGEAHLPMSGDAFIAARDAGAFALWWAAHGLLYGIPRDIEVDIAAGRAAVANLSRAVLAEAAALYPLRVLEITAPIALRAARLASRGRETEADVAARLARDQALPPDLDVETVVNDADVATGVARVVAALSRAAADARRAGTARPAPPG
ncbi:phosphonate metabolism protein/1,5-bisphosphokinase (PRPP-forming) PhnN [Falsiroseomonas oryziterrae]|uniref:phosphonate metabolism protein/1,5-bisphosphokinase (PRPP-forming) PhnN n=1 Tax=Falsiroseomonas oryziterrae TaxID=2911368 RepID=UPI001F01AD0E|nr:phosphonate metabolism protein/1,5-bisphosphokinase (PRPP-forming) PhnN [Roseomonas sp. NPKOSM-4]